MAGPTISSLTLASAGLSADEFAIEVSGVSEKITLSQISVFCASGTTLESIPDDEASILTTSMVRVSGMDVLNVVPGTYTFEYYINAQVSITTQTVKFAVNHTGSTTSFMYNLFHPGSLNTTANAAMDQERTGTAGAVYCVNATRIKNTTLGPQASIDSADADIFYRISGVMVVTSSGTLELYHGCETLTGSGLVTIKAGTSLILKKVG